MTVLTDIEEIPASPEDDSRAYLGTHSTEDLPAAIQAESYARPAGVGSSHTKISFVPAKDDDDDNDYQNKAESSHPRHRSPPPYHTSNEHETATAGGSGGNDVWTNNDLPMDLDVWDNNGFSLLEDGNNEKMWWNASNRKALRPLGPGFLPVLTASKIHEESHTLMAITVTPPDLPIGTADTTSDTSRPFKQPRQSDVISAVPHPNAYYCSKCNGWVIVRGASTSEPPIYSSYKDACPELNFPSARVDKRCNSQWHGSYGGGSGGPDPLEAHHYHMYEDSIPSTSLNPPFARSSWEHPPSLPRKLCSQHESTTENFWKLPTNIMLEAEPEEMHHGVDRTADYLDLYACCVCTQNIYVTRNVIPGIVSPRLIMDLRRERSGVDRNSTRVAVAFEFIIKILEGLLWRGDNRLINYQGNSFQRSFGEDAQALRIWEQLGYQIDRETKHLIPPPLDTSDSRQQLLRAWVELSAYTADFHRSYPKSIASRMQDGRVMIHKLWVKVSDASDQIADLIGSHPNQIPRGTIEAPQAQYDHVFELLGLTQSSFTPKLLAHAYKLQARCDITHLPIYLDGLTTLVENILPSLSHGINATLVTEELGDLIIMERSKDRWIPSQYEDALRVLQFGPDSPLLINIFEADANFFENAYKELLRQTWRPTGSGYGYGVGEPLGGISWNADLKMRMGPDERRQLLKESVRIVAEGTGREEFYALYKRISEPWASMDPEKAYTTLAVPSDTTDDMLLTVYALRVLDAPSSEERMTEALQVLAEARNSARLREFLRSGIDPGEAGSVIVPDWPRGLNQLGNTCYLNSLLQYFYTIKDLRQVILSIKSDEQIQLVKGDKLSDAQLQKHRVGGRLVTRKEIERSRQFLAQLSDLFTQMAWGDANAITPSLELAKLALVTSKDEEEDEAKSNPTVTAGTSSSPSTDATLVEESSALHPPLLPTYGYSASTSAGPALPANATVLGKRSREVDLEAEKAEQLTAEGNSTSTSKPRSPRREDSPPPDKTMRVDEPPAEDQEMFEIKRPEGYDTNMEDAGVSSVNASQGGSTPGSPALESTELSAETTSTSQPPPLPKRQPPPLPPRKQPASDSVMMFGKQHDVAECMDNCMFQIETALLDFEGPVNVDAGTTSVVKRLFYGKMRQRITALEDDPNSSGKKAVNEKDDLFSHLPVNVSEEGFDIYDGLGGYFRDTVEFEGKKATMEVTLIDLPPILQIQLQRVQFNRETLQPYKSQSYVRFGENLYMDRYLEDADPEKKARSRVIQERLCVCRDRINAMTHEHGVPMTEALKNTAGFLGSQTISELVDSDGVSEYLAQTLTDEVQRLEKELVSLRAEVVELKAELEQQWKDERMAEYELTSVFIHRGSSPSWGHYFFYARNLPDKPDEWFKYNDSTVSTAKKEEVLADTTGSTANPYLLVFARKGSGVVHTVNRPS